MTQILRRKFYNRIYHITERISGQGYIYLWNKAILRGKAMRWAACPAEMEFGFAAIAKKQSFHL